MKGVNMSDFVRDYALYWKNYANFRGRTPRRGFWFVMLWQALIYVVWMLLLFLFGLFPSAILNTIMAFVFSVYLLVNFIPNLSLQVRRLHDTGRRWYWLLMQLIPYVLAGIFILFAVAQAQTEILVLSSSLYGFGGEDALVAFMLNFLVYVVIVSIVGLIVSIIWIVLMALPTSPGAIGVSTHDGTQVSASRGGVSSSTLAAAIVGVDGMYKGGLFPIEPNEEIIIGRDSALAHIVIDKGAAKVSRKHCGIVYDANRRMYTVYDYSSNGTFKEDGSRLLANTGNLLPRGTLISLGNRNNSLRLR
jgi:uncharacterized membrane protein YhaH (DUF805 family)